MKSGGVPREGSTMMKLLLISSMEMHGSSHTSFYDRTKGRGGNLSGRGKTRETTDVSRTDYTLLQPKNLAAAHP